MAVEYSQVTQDVLDIAQELIDKYHHHLLGANIGFVFREPAAKSGGKVVLGKASKITNKYRPYLKQELDFMIELAGVEWCELDSRRQVALVDHELCHLGMDDDGNLTIRAHDVEEFTEIVMRHGLWYQSLEQMADAVKNPQLLLFSHNKRNGSLVAVDGWKHE